MVLSRLTARPGCAAGGSHCTRTSPPVSAGSQPPGPFSWETRCTLSPGHCKHRRQPPCARRQGPGPPPCPGLPAAPALSSVAVAGPPPGLVPPCLSGEADAATAARRNRWLQTPFRRRRRKQAVCEGRGPAAGLRTAACANEPRAANVVPPVKLIHEF